MEIRRASPPTVLADSPTDVLCVVCARRCTPLSLCCVRLLCLSSALGQVFVDLEKDGLLEYPELLEFRPKAGDLIVWHAKAIHKIDGPKSQDWDASRRRVLGGTVALNDAKYLAGGRLLFSDMGSHGLEDGEPLSHALFPKIYPRSDPAERAEAAAGRCTRTWEGVSRMWGNMFASMGEMSSFANVVNLGGKKE